MSITRVDFRPLAQGGDNGTAALIKLDTNDADLDVRVAASQAAIAAAQASISALGSASTRNVGTSTGTVAAGDDSRFNLGGFRNQLINGGLDFWQRGVSFSGVGYHADRFFTVNAGSTFNVSQLVAPVGNGYTQSKFGLLYAITSVAGASNYVTCKQGMERVSRLAGKTVTVSLTAYAGIAGKKIGISLDQNFGTGGAPSGIVSGAGQSLALTTAPARYSKTFVLPAIAGKTLGSNNNDCTVLNLWLDAGSTFDGTSGAIGQLSTNVVIYDIQVEVGTVATDFEQRPLGLELALCQRYYEKSFDVNITPGINISGNTNMIGSAYTNQYCRSQFIPFKVPKRATPTMVAFTDSLAASQQNKFQLWNGSIYNVPDLAFTFEAAAKGFSAEMGFGSGLTVNAAYLIRGNWTADAEL